MDPMIADPYTIPADAGAPVQRTDDLTTWSTSSLQTTGRNTRSIREARAITAELSRRDDLRWAMTHRAETPALFGAHGDVQCGLF